MQSSVRQRCHLCFIRKGVIAYGPLPGLLGSELLWKGSLHQTSLRYPNLVGLFFRCSGQSKLCFWYKNLSFLGVGSGFVWALWPDGMWLSLLKRVWGGVELVACGFWEAHAHVTVDGSPGMTLPVVSKCRRHLCHLVLWTRVSGRLPFPHQLPQTEHRVHHGDREWGKTTLLGRVGTQRRYVPDNNCVQKTNTYWPVPQLQIQSPPQDQNRYYQN